MMAGGTSYCSIQHYFLVLNQGGCDIRDLAELENDLKFDAINRGTVSLHC